MKEPVELTLGADTYRIGQLDSMRQFHITRRLGPIMTMVGLSMTELFSKLPLLDMKQGPDGKVIEAEGVDRAKVEQEIEQGFLSAMAPIMEVVSKMDDDQVEYIVKTCLSVVHRRQGDKWAKMMNGGNFMFQDLNMNIMIRLTIEVIKENVGDFFFQPPGEAK